jgi:hypothetical protein
MRSRSGVVVAALLASMLVALGATAPAARADEARDAIARLVRQLGYGAGIHHFKNWVLRHREINYEAAKTAFADARSAVAGLRAGAGLDAEGLAALSDVETVIEAYTAALERVAELHAKGWRIEDIDSTVIIDDTAAIAGLDFLRSGRTGSALEEVEFYLGYGKGIHEFKNYVLRGRERDHTGALESLLAVDSAAADWLAEPGLDEPSRAALETVARTARAYREHLALIERLLGAHRSVRQIDLAVKINDGPAVAALQALRARAR